MSKNEVIRFRCAPELKRRFEIIARMERREESDLARLVFEDYVAREESRLGLEKPKIIYQPHRPMAFSFNDKKSAQSAQSADKNVSLEKTGPAVMEVEQKPAVVPPTSALPDGTTHPETPVRYRPRRREKPKNK